MRNKILEEEKKEHVSVFTGHKHVCIVIVLMMLRANPFSPLITNFLV